MRTSPCAAPIHSSHAQFPARATPHQYHHLTHTANSPIPKPYPYHNATHPTIPPIPPRIAPCTPPVRSCSQSSTPHRETLRVPQRITTLITRVASHKAARAVVTVATARCVLSMCPFSAPALLVASPYRNRESAKMLVCARTFDSGSHPRCSGYTKSPDPHLSRRFYTHPCAHTR